MRLFESFANIFRVPDLRKRVAFMLGLLAVYRLGGQMPLHRRLPKRGFTNIFKKQFAIVNLGRLEKLEGDVFNADRLTELGVIHRLGAGLKILGAGQLTRAITVEAHQFSKSAADKIAKAGGKAQVIGATA